MSAAAVTPNVKGIVVCDETFGSDIEENVYDLERVRQEIVAPALPCVRTFFVFLQLESGRAGEYNGNLRINHDATGREVRRVNLTATFAEDRAGYQGRVFLIHECRFPRAGRYNIEVWFWDHEGREVQKGHREFDLIEEEWS